MFGRKKQVDDIVEDADDTKGEDVAEDSPEDDDLTEHEDDESIEDDAGAENDKPVEDERPEDKWAVLDVSRDWREDGPFDITEVDLDADDVQRLDFGTVVVTPFDGMQLQMQINQATSEVQALLVVDKEAALEVALFAAPARSSMLAEVRDSMAAATAAGGGTFRLVEGPLGTEIRRTMPVVAPDGRTAKQASRTWLVQGPRWLLRGVLLGQAATSDQVDGDTLLFEFFCNLVVRRGDTPHVPGDLIPLEVPAAIVADIAKQAAQAS